jgi:hypothetical protein
MLVEEYLAALVAVAASTLAIQSDDPRFHQGSTRCGVAVVVGVLLRLCVDVGESLAI